jgi:hypothetical protein
MTSERLPMLALVRLFHTISEMVDAWAAGEGEPT